MLAIKNNLMAVNAARQLGVSYDSLARSVERLSSGLRINTAKDDAAGLAVRELMRADIAVLQQGARNAQDGIGLLQTMEGAMQTIDDALVRMKQLAQQAVTGTYSSEQRAIMNNEFAEMADEIERIATTTKFNDTTYLDNTNTVVIQVGEIDNVINITGVDMTKAGLSIETGSSGYAGSADHLVADPGDAWLTLNDAINTGETVTLDITFSDIAAGTSEAAISVNFTGPVPADAGSKAYSLTEVVDAINAVSQALPVAADGTVQAYTAASVVQDSATGQYTLQLGSRTYGADSAAITLTTPTNTSTAGGFVLAANQAATSMVEDPIVAGDNGMLNVGSTNYINVLTTAAANDAMDAITAAIIVKDTARAAFGYKMNRLEYTVGVTNIQAENIMAAESRISDVDVATEMARMTRLQVLAQAGVAMLSHANLMPQMALSLLR
ncbi:MAG: flagellin N-terminal helical domain-containing protein [Planctomycetota bacterium]|jgi:flagellin